MITHTILGRSVAENCIRSSLGIVPRRTCKAVGVGRPVLYSLASYGMTLWPHSRAYPDCTIDTKR